MNKYMAGIYARESRIRHWTEGEYQKGSIENQIMLCKSFAEEHPEIELVKVYCDKGYTGVNFERPAFKEMIEDVENGEINTIVIKDFSRLGRNYLEVGRYAEEFFPRTKTRLIAVFDEYDSNTCREDGISIVLALKSVIDESYAQDISLKIRSEQKMKRKLGLFIGSYAVYGYQKSAKNRHLLIIDKEVEGNVKNIFEMKADRKSCAEIADALNEKGVLAPNEYKKQCNSTYQTHFQIYENAKWYPATVERIIKNRVYIGNMEQGKERKPNYKSDIIIKVPEEEWDVREEMHEAIVSKELYEKANKELRGGKRRATTLFGGILFCADCGQPMVRKVIKWKRKETVYYVCSTNNKGKGCSRHSVREENIKKAFKKMKKGDKFFVTENGEIDL